MNNYAAAARISYKQLPYGITDAYRDKVALYARYGFIPIEGSAKNGPQRKFLDVRTIRVAYERGDITR
jgi:hypothetical protein